MKKLAALSLLVLALVGLTSAQTGTLEIVAYQFVGEQRISRNQSIVSYSATMLNEGQPLLSTVNAIGRTSDPNIVFVLPAGNHLVFNPPVDHGASEVSTTTFVRLLVDRRAPVAPNLFAIKWTFYR